MAIRCGIWKSPLRGKQKGSSRGGKNQEEMVGCRGQQRNKRTMDKRIAAGQEHDATAEVDGVNTGRETIRGGAESRGCDGQAEWGRLGVVVASPIGATAGTCEGRSTSFVGPSLSCGWAWDSCSLGVLLGAVLGRSRECVGCMRPRFGGHQVAGQTGLFQSEGSTSAAVRPFSGALATEMPKEEGDPRVAVDRLSGRPHKARREVIYAAANCPRRAGAPWRPVGGRSEGR